MEKLIAIKLFTKLYQISSTYYLVTIDDWFYKNFYAESVDQAIEIFMSGGYRK